MVIERLREIAGAIFGGSAWIATGSYFILCAPCFAAIGAIKREMNNRKWTWFAIGYECGFAYAVAFVVYQLGSMAAGTGNILGTILAVAVIGAFLWLLFRPYKEATKLTKNVKVA